MRVLITGADGQLGHALRRQAPAGLSLLLGSRRESLPEAPDEAWLKVDFSDLTGLAAMLDRVQPELIINAAAYTAVDQAELEPQLAWQVNAEAPAVLANWCAANAARLQHVSTDYVFDGQATQPYGEAAETRPLGVYGASKLGGEQAIDDAACQAVVLRTSWLYSERPQNFLTTMIRLARGGAPIRVVNDQLGRPTSAHSLAAAIWQLAGTWPGSEQPVQLYHCCDADIRSWYDFAHSLFQQAVALGVIEQMPELQPVSSEAFPTRARRPAYSVLDCSKLAATSGWQPVAMEQALRQCLLAMPADATEHPGG